MIDENILGVAGLSPTEGRILLVLLKGGPTHPAALARDCGLFRPQVYDALDRLSHRNLVSYILKNRRRIYSATDAKTVVHLLESKRKAIDEAIPELLKTYSQSTHESVTILTGMDGLKLMLHTVLAELAADPKKNCYRVMLSDATPITMLGPWLVRWHKKRNRLGLRAQLIFTPDAAWRGRQLEKYKATEIHYIKKYQTIPLGLHSCGRFAWVILWGGPMVIQIEDAKIARAFDEYFELMWAAASPKPPLKEASKKV